MYVCKYVRIIYVHVDFDFVYTYIYAIYYVCMRKYSCGNNFD